MKKFLSLMLALLLALPGSALAAGEYDPVGQQITGIHAPYIDEDGLPSETDFFTDECFSENRVTVINFWDSGCINCRIEMPGFELAYNNYRERGVGFLGVATRWIGGQYEQCITILHDLGITYPNVFIDDGFNALTSEHHHCPQTMIADENGVILEYISGRINYAELEAAICRHIAIHGDTDDDGSVTFSDASLLSAYVLNLAELAPLSLAAADMNLDGTVDMLDLPAVCQAALGE